MKYKKANNWITELQSHPDWGHCDIEWGAVDEIEDALSILNPRDIRIEKEPRLKQFDNAYCPHCGKLLAYGYTKQNEEMFYKKFCDNCGQNLKW